MDTIKIGTSENCDIKFYGKDITGSVWATISASDKKMLVLKILANNYSYIFKFLCIDEAVLI